MNRPIRILCIVVAVLTLLTFLTPVVRADDDDTTNGLFVSKTSVEQDSRFYAYVHIPAAETTADALAVRIDYDPTVFEAAGWSSDLGIASDLQFSKVNNTEGYCIITTANTEDAIDLSKGLTLTAEMKAKPEALTGRHYIKLTRASAVSAEIDGEEIKNVALWEPEVTEVPVDVTRNTSALYPVTGGGISLSSYALKRGDHFTVLINVPQAGYAQIGNLLVGYDGSAFELVSWMPDIRNASVNTGSSYFSLYINNSSATTDLTRGLTLYASMKVRDDAEPGTYTFRLDRASFTRYDADKQKYIEMWQPTDTLVNAAVYKQSGTVPGDIVIVPDTPPTTTGNTHDAPPTTTDNADELEYSTDEQESVLPAEPESVVEEIVPYEYEVYDDPYYVVPVDDSDHYYYEYEDPDDSETIIEEDDDDYYDGYDRINGRTPASSYAISLDCSGLSGLSARNVTLTTKGSFFPGNSTVILANTDYAKTCADSALRRLGMYNHIYYPFDISIFNTDTNRYVHDLVPGGYIELQIPVPQEMLDAPENIEVFHIEEGHPVVLDRDIVTEGGTVMVRFQADTFSPYMFADTSRTYTDQQNGYVEIDDGPDIITDKNTVPHNGNLNPNTGVAAAVVLPAAVTGCVFLARKTVRRRKRAKSNIDDSEDDIPDEPAPPELPE